MVLIETETADSNGQYKQLSQDLAEIMVNGGCIDYITKLTSLASGGMKW